MRMVAKEGAWVRGSVAGAAALSAFLAFGCGGAKYPECGYYFDGSARIACRNVFYGVRDARLRLDEARKELMAAKEELGERAKRGPVDKENFRNLNNAEIRVGFLSDKLEEMLRMRGEVREGKVRAEEMISYEEDLQDLFESIGDVFAMLEKARKF